MVEDRYYQQEAQAAILGEWEKGIQKTLLVLPTGTGKTIVFSKIIEHEVRNGKRVLVMAHRGELLDQAADKLAKATGLGCAVEKAESSCLDSWYRVVVGSVQTLMRESRLKLFPPDYFGDVIIDECFPAGTLVDGIPIEQLKIGDIVSCFDEATGEIKQSPITHVFCNSVPPALIQICTNCQKITCTENHPIFTPQGWIIAKNLKEGDYVYVHMSSMRRTDENKEITTLHGLLPKRYDRTKPQRCAGKNDNKQSDAKPNRKGKNARQLIKDTSRPYNKRWERKGYHGSAVKFIESIRMAIYRICRTDTNTSRFRISDMLQNRYRKSKFDDSCRGRWTFARFSGKTTAGCKERNLLEISRVDSVEILKQGDFAGFGRLCPDGKVYNIEVKKYSTYFANGLAVHNCHHALADSYQRVLSHFDKANVLGVTATADRSDMRNLGEYFETLAYEYTLPRAIKDGYLSPIKAQTIPLKLDLTGVGMSQGDFKVSDLGTALDPYLYQIADEMVKYCMDRKTLVFLPLIKTSQKFCEILKSKGFAAGEVNGDSDDRAEKLADFESGRYNVLCNSMLLTEGYDNPSIDCVVVLRPTKIRSLYAQMIGRGTRLHPGKDHLLLLDFLWHTERHELCHPAHLICESADVAQKMTENIEAAGCPVDIIEEQTNAESDVVAAREEALAKQLAEMRRRKAKLVDPLQFEMSIQAEDLSGYAPAFGYQMGPPSDKQKATLEKLGILPDQIDNAGKAELLLNRLAARRTEGLTTPKQIRFLENRGFLHVGTWQFESAKKLIDRIAGNGWTTPRDIDPKTFKPKETSQAELNW